jgi:hypothetical protein
MAILVGKEVITRRRFAGGTRGTDGRYVPGAATDTPINASVQPIGGVELQTLEEGDRQRDPKRVYTDSDLRTSNQHVTPKTKADHVIIDSVVYQVRRVDTWRSVSPIPHVKAIVVRLQEPDVVSP